MTRGGNSDRTPLRRARATEERRRCHAEQTILELARDKDLGLDDADVEYLLKRYRELADQPMLNLVSEQEEGYKPDLSPKCVPFAIGRTRGANLEGRALHKQLRGSLRRGREHRTNDRFRDAGRAAQAAAIRAADPSQNPSRDLRRESGAHRRVKSNLREGREAACAVAQAYQDEHPLALVFVVGSDAWGLHVH